MNKTEKIAEVASLKERFAKSQLAILADYKGLKVAEFNLLRRKLEEKNSKIKVIKNRLAKIALHGTVHEILISHLKGTTAVTTTETDPVGPAKVLIDFLKDHEAVKIKTAVMNGKEITHAEIKALASLPSREALIAQLMGSMMAPARNWVSVLAQIPRRLVTVLAAVRDQKGKQ
ncbi:MAG: 50S ribosomal protein L10, partial [Deltaproteobacteria bacterium]|nr:50S ribosomal protein L10 [Deltaproteobacteria bacterium]